MNEDFDPREELAVAERELSKLDKELEQLNAWRKQDAEAWEASVMKPRYQKSRDLAHKVATLEKAVEEQEIADFGPLEFSHSFNRVIKNLRVLAEKLPDSWNLEIQNPESPVVEAFKTILALTGIILDNDIHEFVLEDYKLKERVLRDDPDYDAGTQCYNCACSEFDHGRCDREDQYIWRVV